MKTRRNPLRGGVSSCGPSTPIKNILDSFAKYWWESLNMDVWHSTSQTGYYFSDRKHNDKPCFMSETHVHIWKMTTSGNKLNVFWAKKIKNVHVSAGTALVNKGGLVSWLKKKINEIINDKHCIDALQIAAKNPKVFLTKPELKTLMVELQKETS